MVDLPASTCPQTATEIVYLLVAMTSKVGSGKLGLRPSKNNDPVVMLLLPLLSMYGSSSSGSEFRRERHSAVPRGLES